MSGRTSVRIYRDDSGDEGDGFAFVDCDGQSVFDLDAAADLDPDRNRAGCYLIASDADEWHARMMEAGMPVTPIEDQPWGMREFVLIDPVGQPGADRPTARRHLTRSTSGPASVGSRP